MLRTDVKISRKAIDGPTLLGFPLQNAGPSGRGQRAAGDRAGPSLGPRNLSPTGAKPDWPPAAGVSTTQFALAEILAPQYLAGTDAF
jgi:hypothetical protein